LGRRSEGQIVVIELRLADGAPGVCGCESTIAVEAFEHGIAVLRPQCADDLLVTVQVLPMPEGDRRHDPIVI
jgi:hypothetical protein